MKKALSLLSFFAVIFALAACGGSIGVVDAGTYSGTIDKVVPEEKEIYVSLDGDELLELYFTETTTLVRNGSSVAFDQLTVGGSVSVTVDREGNRNIPTRVEIEQ